MEWILIEGEDYITDSAIVTRLIRGKYYDVTIGYPGWGLYNDTIAYIPLPRPINEDNQGWKSEYCGDESPKKDGRYIIQIQGINAGNQGKTRIIEAYYEKEKDHWLWVPNGYEVIAWRNFPKPYKQN